MKDATRCDCRSCDKPKARGSRYCTYHTSPTPLRCDRCGVDVTFSPATWVRLQHLCQDCLRAAEGGAR